MFKNKVTGDNIEQLLKSLKLKYLEIEKQLDENNLCIDHYLKSKNQLLENKNYLENYITQTAQKLTAYNNYLGWYNNYILTIKGKIDEIADKQVISEFSTNNLLTTWSSSHEKFLKSIENLDKIWQKEWLKLENTNCIMPFIHSYDIEETQETYKLHVKEVKDYLDNKNNGEVYLSCQKNLNELEKETIELIDFWYKT